MSATPDAASRFVIRTFQSAGGQSAAGHSAAAHSAASKSVAGWQARAYRGDKPFGDIKRAKSEAAAIAAVTAMLEEVEAADRASRETDGYPGAAAVRQALQVIAATPQQRAMLQAHFNAPGHVMTARGLAEAVGQSDYRYANSQYGKLGHILADELGWSPERRSDGTIMWISSMATGVASDDAAAADSGEFLWQLRDQMVAALTVTQA
jgi:hypothetical protein